MSPEMRRFFWVAYLGFCSFLMLAVVVAACEGIV